MDPTNRHFFNLKGDVFVCGLALLTLLLQILPKAAQFSIDLLRILVQFVV